jgi:hypothetical protein
LSKRLRANRPVRPRRRAPGRPNRGLRGAARRIGTLIPARTFCRECSLRPVLSQGHRGCWLTSSNWPQFCKADEELVRDRRKRRPHQRGRRCSWAWGSNTRRRPGRPRLAPTEEARVPPDSSLRLRLVVGAVVPHRIRLTARTSPVTGGSPSVLPHGSTQSPSHSFLTLMTLTFCSQKGFSK